MRILLVNAHRNTPQGKTRFSHFHQYILTGLKSLEKYAVEVAEIVIRTGENVDDFLFDDGTMFTDPESKLRFDRIDAVFIDGDPNILPWESAARKIGVLFQQCKTVDKPLWASGCGMHMLIYYCATNYRPINVINGFGKGGNLSHLGEISNIPQSSRDVLLDNRTGDYYCFDPVFLRPRTIKNRTEQNGLLQEM